MRARKSFIELALFLIFLTVLFLVSFNNRDPRWFFATNHIEQHLISFPHEIAAKTTQSFSKVSQAYFLYWWKKRYKKRPPEATNRGSTDIRQHHGNQKVEKTKQCI